MLQIDYNVYTPYYENYAIISGKVNSLLLMSKTKILNLRIDPELKKAAKKLADKEDRSLSNWVTRLIRRELERSGHKRP